MSEKEQDIYDAVAEFREKNPEPKAVDVTLWEACRVVETHLKELSLGTVQIYIKPTRVHVAPVSWDDDAIGNSLFDALMAAKERKAKE